MPFRGVQEQNKLGVTGMVCRGEERAPVQKAEEKLMWLRWIIANQRKACHAVNDVTRMGAKSVRYER